MRTFPNGVNTAHANSTDLMALREHKTITYDNETFKLPPLSQVDCLALHRVDNNSIERENQARLALMERRQKRVVTKTINGREYEFGRKKKRKQELPNGEAPPISQIVMGPSGDRELPTKTHHKMRHYQPRRKDNVNLPPISQVSCLGPQPNEEKPRVIPDKFQVHDRDSEYVKLAKTGGRHDLLHYVEAEPTLRRSRGVQYRPESKDALPALKTKSCDDPTWMPSQWQPLSPIKKSTEETSKEP